MLNTEELQLFLADSDPEANLLLDDHEFDAKKLQMALQHAVDRWNDSPPRVGGTYTVANWPWPYYLKLAAAATLLRSAALLYDRNNAPYKAGAAVINDQNKGPAYHAAADRFRVQADDWFVAKKNELNINSGFATF